MTAEEFEKQYAKALGGTVTRLHEQGRYGEPCDCDSADCQGFKMACRDCASGHPTDGYHPWFECDEKEVGE